MRPVLLFLALFLALPVCAAEPIDEASAADATWHGLLARAQQEKKPILVLFRTASCERCVLFERRSIPHPTIERRLPNVLFAMLPAGAGEAAKRWSSADPGLAFFDRTGALRARWPMVPDTTNFGIIIDSVVAVAPQLERAAQLAESGSTHAADLETGIALSRLARVTEARAALTRARGAEDVETRQTAMVALAMLDAKEGRVAEALAQLQQLGDDAATPKIAAEVARAKELLAPKKEAPVRGSIRILPLGRQVVSGRHTVRTHVSSTAVARVVFSLDGRELARVARPPFATTIDFGAVPERHVIHAVAYSRGGSEIGRDERVVNEAGETFWLRLASPREGFVAGPVRVSMNVRVPAARRVTRLALSWNDAERAVLTAAPWDATVEIPRGQVGVLRAVAELDDGRTTEDAVLLNGGGMTDRSVVQLVELPITVVSRTDATPELTPERITVREGKNNVRRVESIATAAETPLTVGMLIDISGSMQANLPDVQEAAIRFLQTILGPRDRAFLVTFDTAARLLQPATSDTALLRRQIMTMRPEGLTALHDAMVLGLLQFEGIKGRRAMVVFSDGLDLTSRYSAADVRDLARRVNVPIHVIATLPGVPAALDAAGKPATQNEETELSRVARATGGTAHTLSYLGELPSVYSRIEAALRAQILAFFRTDPASRDDEWRAVKVEVGAQNVEVYAPEGYYATW